MKKNYETMALEVLLLEDDVVRCSNTFEKGDSVSEDIFE